MENVNLELNNNMIEKYKMTNDILSDMKGIIDGSRIAAYHAVNMALLQRNWLIGYRIASEELTEDGRAEYGAEVIK